MEAENFGERSSYELKSLASRIKGFHHALTAEELADFLQVSRLTILRRAKRGTIPSGRGRAFGSTPKTSANGSSIWV